MGFPFDEEFYTMMLHQLGTNCRRICDLGNRNINLLVFEEQIRLMKKYFPNLEEYQTLNRNYKEIDEAVHQKNYKKYLLACLFLN